jgi:hypothetical protein
MKYLILVRAGARADFGAAHHRLAGEMAAAGVYVASEGLADLAHGRRVTAASGPADDGELAGFYLVDCADLDDAISWAARVPGANVEVRPVLRMGGAEF